MIQQKGTAVLFYGYFSESKVGKTGLTVTVDVYEGTSSTKIVDGGNATELAGGTYYYELASGSVDVNTNYLCIFKTATTTVDAQHVPAMWACPAWVDNVDASISTVDTVVDAIKANTDNIPESPATEAKQDTIIGYIDTEVAAIKAKTDNLPASPAATGEIPTAVQIRTEMDSNSTQLTAIKAKTDGLNFTGTDVKATLDGEQVVTDAASRTASKADVSGLATSADLTTVDTVVDAIKMVTDKLDTSMELDGAVYRFTENALEEAPTGGSAPTVEEIRTEMDTNSTKLTAILDDTAELQTNQDNWLTATGFSTHSAADIWAVGTRTLTSFGTLVADIWAHATRSLTTFGTLVADTWAYATRALTDKAGFSIAGTKKTLDALNDFDPATDEVDVGKVKGVAVVSVDDFKADVSGVSTFNAGTDTVTVGNPNDCKADVSALATSAEITALNDINASDVVLAMQAVANDFKADVSGLSTFDPTTEKVTLADGAHGGAAATIVLSDYSDFQGAPTVEQIRAEIDANSTQLAQIINDIADLETHGDSNWGSGAVPTADEIADAVWDELMATHTTAGTAGAALLAAGTAGDPNTGYPASYTSGQIGYLIGQIASRLNTSNAVVQAALTRGVIDIRRGDTLSLTLEGLGILTGNTNIWFTLKRNLSDADAEALIQVDRLTGLLRVNGAAGTAGNASITVVDAVEGDILITVAAADMAGLTLQSGVYFDVQVLNDGVVSTLSFGKANIVGDVTKRVS